MRYVSFTAIGRPGWGVVEGDRIVDLSVRGRGLSFLDHLVAGAGVERLKGQTADYALGDVELNVPLEGSRIFCVGFNYHAHRTEMEERVAESPLIFLRSSQSIVAAGASLWRPASSDQFDFEGELACIIGKGGRHIAKVDALDHVFGYSIFNDGSIRDFQSSSITAGKNFDASGAFGPWVVDADEAPAWNAMSITTRLNGQVVQESDTDLMIFGLPDLIAYISKITRLLPGDVIATGTPSGVGFRRSPPLWMKPGDTVEVAVKGVGLLSNPVIAEPV